MLSQSLSITSRLVIISKHIVLWFSVTVSQKNHLNHLSGLFRMLHVDYYPKASLLKSNTLRMRRNSYDKKPQALEFNKRQKECVPLKSAILMNIWLRGNLERIATMACEAYYFTSVSFIIKLRFVQIMMRYSGVVCSWACIVIFFMVTFRCLQIRPLGRLLEF